MSSPWRAEEKASLFGKTRKQHVIRLFYFDHMKKKNKSNPILSFSCYMYFLCLSVSLKEEKTFSLISLVPPHPPADVHSVSCIRESSLSAARLCELIDQVFESIHIQSFRGMVMCIL